MRGWKVFLLILGSLFWMTNLNLPVEGCSFAPDYLDEYSSFFLSNLGRDSLFQRYYYDAENRRSDYQLDEAIVKNQTELNLKEWQNFFGGKITGEKLTNLVYELPLAELRDIYQKIRQNQVQPRLGESLYRPEFLPAFAYLIYAKECEPYAIVSSPWDWEEEIKKRRKPEEMQKLIEAGLIKYQNEKDLFLKARYGYQIVRLAHYAGKYEDCIRYYDRLVTGLVGKSIVADWALRLKNGALAKVGRNAEAIVLTSLMFDQKVNMIDEAYLDYETPPDPVWEECLRLAGQPHRQATLWMLRGLKELRITIEPLRKMYELEPKSSRLEVMLVRSINRIERTFTIKALFLTSADPEVLEQRNYALKYIRELREFIDAVDKPKTRQPGLWYAVAAYLSILERDPAATKAYLDKAEGQTNLSGDLINEIRLLRNLNEVLVSTKLAAPLEEPCLASLEWLDPAREAKSNLVNMRDSFYAVLAQRYYTTGESAKGYVCLLKAGLPTEDLVESRLTLADFDRIITFMNKKGKTRYESLITSGLIYRVDDLYSFKVTRLVRQGKYSDALENLTKISPDYWNKVKKDWDQGYYGQIRTDFAVNHYNPRTGLYKYPKGGFPYYTKLEFFKKVSELQALACRYPARADRYYFQIANGFFQTPFWAYNENMRWSKYGDYVENWVMGATTKPEMREWASFYAAEHRKVALAYYLKTMQVTKDKELAAKCCFLAQACKTKFSYYFEFEEPGKEHFYYFRILKQQYSDTAFYKNVIKECSTLRDYLGGKTN